MTERPDLVLIMTDQQRFDQVGYESGGYFVDRQRVAPTQAAQDRAAARRLWEISEGQLR